MNDYVKALDELKAKAGIFEIYHRSTFKCYRNKQHGGVQEVLIELLDAGPTQQYRYSVVATSTDGKSASGNPGSSLEEAIAFVHWWDLDK
ncbi:MAG TPA: hypothetical protein VI750_09295 [Pyrinomonadaceae bacterium]|nr:hypothetical protein [Pyrinomonadaceae bacterium]